MQEDSSPEEPPTWHLLCQPGLIDQLELSPKIKNERTVFFYVIVSFLNTWNISEDQAEDVLPLP